MIKKLPLFFLFLTFYCTAQAPAIEWQKALGGTAGEAATAVQLTSDNGFIMTGYTSSNNGDVTGSNGGVEFWVVKISSTGTLEWQKNYGGTSTDIARSIAQTSDGGYIVAGQTSSNNIDVIGAHGLEDCWVLKLDSFGNIQWSRALGGSDYENTEQIIQTADGGYIFSAYSSSINGDVVGNTINNTNFWIVKLTPNGAIEWQKIYGGSGSDHGRCILQTADGGYVVGGQTNSTNGDISFNHGNYDAWLIKLNNLGNLEWQKTYGGSAIDDMVHVRQTNDGGFVAAIASNSADGDVTGNHGGSYDYWIVKTDAQGTIEWQKAYGGTAVEVIADVKQTPDNGFVAFGQSGSINGDVTGTFQLQDFWIMKTDASGVLQWQRKIGGNLSDEGRSLTFAADGGIVMAGDSNSTNGDISGLHGGYDLWVVKLQPELSIPEMHQTVMSLSPNPVKDLLHIQLTSERIPEKTTITDLTGKTVIESASASIDTQNLASGTYIVKVISKNEAFTQKIIKE